MTLCPFCFWSDDSPRRARKLLAPHFKHPFCLRMRQIALGSSKLARKRGNLFCKWIQFDDTTVEFPIYRYAIQCASSTGRFDERWEYPSYRQDKMAFWTQMAIRSKDLSAAIDSLVMLHEAQPLVAAVRNVKLLSAAWSAASDIADLLHAQR